MKKIKKLLVVLVTIIILPISVNAASASISVKTSGKAVVGNIITSTITLSSGSPLGSWEINVSYDSSKLQLVSSNAENGSTHMAGYASNGNTKSKVYTLKFKVLKSGNASINVGGYEVYAFDESKMTVGVTNATIKAMTQAELEATYSKNNNLKSITVDEYELSPEFNKDVLEYSVKVPSTIDSVNINATKEDSTASIDGTGVKEVVEGSNPFEIVVTAQNGSTKTYKLNIIVEDINPINVKINNKDYTVVKRADNLESPKGFEATTITIDEMEIPAFESKLLNLIVVGIKDSEGNIIYAIYKDGKYELYNDISSNSITIYLLELPKNDKFITKSIKINDNEVKVYKYKDSSKYSLVYGKNVETGEEGYYMYDEKENTFQRYNDEQIKDLKNEIKNYLYVIYAFSGCLVLIFISFIISIFAKKKAKNKINKKIEQEEKNEEIIKEIMDDKKKNKK